MDGMSKKQGQGKPTVIYLASKENEVSDPGNLVRQPLFRFWGKYVNRRAYKEL